MYFEDFCNKKIRVTLDGQPLFYSCCIQVKTSLKAKHTINQKNNSKVFTLLIY